jgi:hypothetical protein
MRFEIRTLARALSTLALLFVLVFGASLDVSAYQRGRGHDKGHGTGRDWGRSHNRGRHLGWERGRRVGQRRRSDGTISRRLLRRDRRDDRRRRRLVRRSSWNNDWQGSRFGRERADYRTRRFVQYRSRY